MICRDYLHAPTAMKRAVFLDRDGAICREVGYMSHQSQFQLLPGAADAIKLFNKNGLKTLVVTNQSGIARGYFSEDVLAAIHRHMSRLLKREGALLDGIYYCPHHPEGRVEPYVIQCGCRKPATGMLTRAALEHDLELSRSYLIGDKLTDMECASRAGVTAILVLTGYGADAYRSQSADLSMQPAYVAPDVLDAARWIIHHSRSTVRGNTDHKTERHR